MKLECSKPLDIVRTQGITFTEFKSMALCNGLDVVAKRGDHVSLEEFRNDLEAVCSGSSGGGQRREGEEDQLQEEDGNIVHMVVSFSRKVYKKKKGGGGGA